MSSPLCSFHQHLQNFHQLFLKCNLFFSSLSILYLSALSLLQSALPLSADPPAAVSPNHQVAPWYLIMPLRTSNHNHQRLTYSCCYFCNRELINCICLINLYPTFAMKYKGFYSTRLNQPTNGLIISIVFNGQTHIILIINAYLYFNTN